MHALLRKFREERAGGDRGFTMIELLVVVVIIGVLVAIAIPLYLNYRKGAENKAAQADVRNAVGVVEQYYTENSNAYPATASATQASAGAQLVLAAAGGVEGRANASPGVILDYELAAGGASYLICGQHNSGGQWYTYDSSNGKLEKKAANDC